MTQRSLFWTDGAGDGGPFTQAQARFTDEALEGFPELRLPWKALGGAPGSDDGVFKRHLSAYSASVVSAVIRIASGRGLCDGTLHESDANVDLTPTVPGVGTTGGLVVLQKSWLRRTVRLALNQSSNGTLAPPALTQTAGVLWEIPLWHYEITTGGAITLKGDRRRYLRATDFDVSLRGFLEDGAYAHARLGGWSGTGTPAAGTRFGVGWSLALSGSGTVQNSEGNSVLRGGWQLQTMATNPSDCGFTGPRKIRITQDWLAVFVLAPVNAVSQSVIAGLHATAGAFADANDQIGFRALNGGNIFAYADRGGTETGSTIDTGIASDSAKHVLVMAVSGGGAVADFWVDGQPKGRITANLPLGSTDLYGQVGIRTTSAADKSLYVGEAVMFARA